MCPAADLQDFMDAALADVDVATSEEEDVAY